MVKEGRKPELIVIAGPNGSGKTSITRKFLHLTKIISRYYKSIANCKTVVPLVDRMYVYDNTIDDEDARPLFRLTCGTVGKMYVADVPEWVRYILPDSSEYQNL